MTTCTKHPTRVVTETGFCFACYQLERDAKYATLRTELERLAAAGVTLLETWPSGKIATAWRFVATGDPLTARITAEQLVGPSTEGEHDAFINGLKPAYLAEHLTNRSQGFGTTVLAFCCDCGDETVEITSDDPVCAKCAEKRQDIEPRDAADDAEFWGKRR